MDKDVWPKVRHGLVCPADGASPLDLEHVDPEQVDPQHIHPEHGHPASLLLCPECQSRYPIHKGIPLFFAKGGCEVGQGGAVGGCGDENTAGDARSKVREMLVRDQEAHKYDRMVGLRLFTLVEKPQVLNELSPSKSDRILEAGCGTGRLTADLAQCGCEVWGLDLSLSSLVQCRRKTGKGVRLFQGDATNPPFNADFFDKIVSCQMLEHMPSSDARRDAVLALCSVLKPGGRLVLTAYRDAFLLRQFAGKEGRHGGDIYYFRFAKLELQALLSECFEDIILKNLGYVWLASARKPKRRSG